VTTVVQRYDGTSGDPLWDETLDLASDTDNPLAAAAKGKRVVVVGERDSDVTNEGDFYVRATSLK